MKCISEFFRLLKATPFKHYFLFFLIRSLHTIYKHKFHMAEDLYVKNKTKK